jgi:hypothetical protein
VNAIEALGLNDAAIVAHYTNARMIFLCLHHIFSPCTNALGATFSECSALLFSAFVFDRRRRPGGWVRPPWWISAEHPESSTQKLIESSRLLEARLTDFFSADYRALPALTRLAKMRYAPGTPAGNCRNHEYPVKM